MISNIERRLSPQGAKRILSLDGGGVRGLITLGYLEKIESLLTEKHGRGEALHLHEYFDLIGGTSTGAVIATLLCLGKRPSEIKQLYLDMLPEVFKARRGFWRKWRSQFGFDTKFDSAAFSRAIDDAFREVARDVGRPPELLSFETDGLKTGLAIFAKRIDTGSAWVQTNNPRRKFWTPVNPAFWPEGADFFANRDYSLKTLVQASAAAPYFVDPVEVSISPKEPGLFIDGGVSPHNNPSKELFLMTTLSGGAGADGSEVLSPHGFGWQTGADDLLMISVGTGYVRPRIGIKEYKALPEVKQAVHALRTIISDADTDAVTWMQAISRHEAPWPINFKLGDMAGLKVTPEPLLSFQRYNQTIEEKPLTDLMGEAWAKENLGPRMLGDLREFDVVTSSNLERLVEIGAVAAEKQVKTDHFPAPFDRN